MQAPPAQPDLTSTPQEAAGAGGDPAPGVRQHSVVAWPRAGGMPPVSRVALSGWSLAGGRASASPGEAVGLKQEDVVAKRRTGLWLASQQQSPANTPEAQRGEYAGLIPCEDFRRGAGPGHIHVCTEPWRRVTEKSATWEAGGPCCPYHHVAPWHLLTAWPEGPWCAAPRQSWARGEEAPTQEPRGGAAASRGWEPQGGACRPCCLPGHPGPGPAASKQPWRAL